MYRYGCIKEVRLSSSLSEKEVDSANTSTEDDTLQSCDDVTFRTWARSLRERHGYESGQVVVVSKNMGGFLPVHGSEGGYNVPQSNNAVPIVLYIAL